MNPCPSRDQLELLALKTLGATDQVAVATHVQGCTACQQSLAALSPHLPTEDWQPPAEPQPESTGKMRVPEELRQHPRYRVLGVLGRGGMGLCTRPSINSWKGPWC